MSPCTVVEDCTVIREIRVIQQDIWVQKRIIFKNYDSKDLQTLPATFGGFAVSVPPYDIL